MPNVFLRAMAWGDLMFNISQTHGQIAFSCSLVILLITSLLEVLEHTSKNISIKHKVWKQRPSEWHLFSLSYSHPFLSTFIDASYDNLTMHVFANTGWEFMFKSRPTVFISCFNELMSLALMMIQLNPLYIFIYKCRMMRYISTFTTLKNEYS